MSTHEHLLDHAERYPELGIRDVFKFIHQSTYGCEHLISSRERAIESIRTEAAAWQGKASAGTTAEPLDGAYSRVHLSILNEGLSPETLGALFYLSAAVQASETEPSPKSRLDAARSLIAEGHLALPLDKFDREAAEWEENGYPALHHSEQFRTAYRPAYRVISNRFVPFLPLFCTIDRAMANGGRVCLAVEGGSASGKSTLGQLLADVYGCTVFHMDDFFLRPEQRTAERFAEPGGNVDRERVLDEILLPLSQGEEITYRRFDCATMSLGKPTHVKPTPLTVLEGAYSMHPTLSPYYNLSVFLDVSPALQRRRIEARNTPSMAERFFGEWIPLETRYFEHFDIKNHCTLTIAIPD